MLLSLLLALAVGGWAEQAFPTNGSAPLAHRAGGVAVIVEPRLHPQLSHVIHSFAARLPADWQLHLVHGSRNAGLAAVLAAELGDRLALTNLGVPDLAPKDTGYNQLLTSPGFWYSAQVLCGWVEVCVEYSKLPHPRVVIHALCQRVRAQGYGGRGDPFGDARPRLSNKHLPVRRGPTRL